MKASVKISTYTIDVRDIFTAMSQHNVSNHIQVEVLRTVDYALCEKHYPQDICGIIDRKIKLLELAEQETATANSNLQLSTKKGAKVNFIRIINCLYELSYFTDKEGNKITKKEVFKTFGNTINQNLSTFQNDLSTTKSAANSDMKSTLQIFEQLYAKQQELNNK